MYIRIILLLILAFAIIPYDAWPQVTDAKGDRKPYYLDLKNSGPQVHELYDDLLSLQYDDRQGKTGSLPLTIYNWRREKVGYYTLRKEYGANYFNVPLTGMDLIKGETYRCHVVNETGQTYELLFKVVQASGRNAPVANIIVSPVSFKCGNPLRNVVEFYGEISNGKAPYRVSWYVVDDTRTEFLYQPRNVQIDIPGRTPIIRVERNPAYYVMLHVIDACGNEHQQMVQLTCSDRRKKINTVFVEPLETLPNKSKITN
jgi:hypothetical protein